MNSEVSNDVRPVYTPVTYAILTQPVHIVTECNQSKPDTECERTLKLTSDSKYVRFYELVAKCLQGYF